jgi:hypothetical protein
MKKKKYTAPKLTKLEGTSKEKAAKILRDIKQEKDDKIE